MIFLLVLYLASGVLLMTLAVPLLFGKIKPNLVYGFRVSQTLDDPQTWYAVNRYAARWLIAAGASIVIAAAVLYFIPSITVDAYALACLLVFVAVFTLGMVKSFRYLKNFRLEE